MFRGFTYLKYIVKYIQNVIARPHFFQKYFLTRLFYYQS